MTIPIAPPAVEVMVEIAASGSGACQASILTCHTIHAAPTTMSASMMTSPINALADFFIAFPLGHVGCGRLIAVAAFVTKLAERAADREAGEI